MVHVIAYPAQRVYDPYKVKTIPICEKVGQYYTSVVTVKKEVDQWFSVRSPVISVYFTQISVISNKRIKKSRTSWIKKLLHKLF